MKKKTGRYLFSMIAAGVFSAHAFGEESGPMQEVKIVAHYDGGVGIFDAASQGTVNASLIESRPILRTGELLEFVPGMIVTQHSGDGKANQYYLRGFNLDHGTDFAIYVDGVPVNMRSHAHGQGYSDLNFLIPELLQRIDYKKGNYFADEGDFASAGAAHIELADSLNKGIASLSMGSHHYQRFVIADSFKTERGSLLFGTEINTNDGPWVVPEGVHKYSTILRYSEGHQDDGFNITAMGYKNRWNSTDQIPLRAIQSGLIARFGTLDPSDGGNSSRYSLSYAMRKPLINGQFEMNAYVLASDLSLYSNFSFLLNNPVDGDQFNQSEHRRMLGLNLSQTWAGKMAGLEMSNKLGLQTRLDTISPVAIYNTVNRVRTGVIREDNIKELSGGLFAENTVEWSPKFRSIAGLRLDRYQFDVQSSIVGNSGQKTAQITSPKLSLVFGPWDKTEYFANYGSGFHSNDARGTTQTRLPSGEPADPVTPLVKTKGAELGLRTELIPGLQTSLALWRLDIDSELLFVGDAGDTAPSRASRRTGIELNNHYVLSPHVLIDLDLAVSRAHYTQYDPVGSAIPGSIGRVASFGIAFKEIGKWSGGLDLRYFGPRALVEDNSVRSSSTFLAYARLGYKIRADTKVTLDVFNLFNKQASDIDYYYPSRLRGEATGGQNDIHFHPVEPRSLRLNLTHTF